MNSFQNLLILGQTAGLLKTSKTNWMPSDFIKPIQFKNATIEKPINIIY